MLVLHYKEDNVKKMWKSVQYALREEWFFQIYLEKKQSGHFINFVLHFLRILKQNHNISIQGCHNVNSLSLCFLFS